MSLFVLPFLPEPESVLEQLCDILGLTYKSHLA
jgi:hypothetical protein